MSDIIDQVTDPDGSPAPDGAQPSVWKRMYHGSTTFDFVGRRRIGYMASGIILVLSVFSLGFRGLNLGIDFKGGVSWEVPSAQIDQAKAESILGKYGISSTDAKIQFLQNRQGSGGDTIRVQVPEQTDAVRKSIREDLAKAAGIANDGVSVNQVSSTWGRQITRKALLALIVFILLLSVYISWRFEWKMAVAAIVAMLHDVAVSVGVYSIFQFTVAPATVIAFLTILGFSLYDTIVVFDKVHENTKRFAQAKVGYGDIVNLSMNQVLMRSLNTSVAALLPVLSVLVVGAWIMGAVVLVDFALALFVGLLTGSYSSLFIATPILAALKQKEKKYANLSSRHASGTELDRLRFAGAQAVTGRAASRNTAAGYTTALGSVEAAKVAASDPQTVLTHPPRPRKKRRR